MIIIAVMLVITLIKTSLLGLGLISILIATLSLFIIKKLSLSHDLTLAFTKIYNIALYGHLSLYAILCIKLLFFNDVTDIPAFIAGHLIIHHILSGLTSVLLMFFTIKLYVNRKSLMSAQKVH
ncbi:hypothetical protein [Pseudoalteromonas citrea]|uniref:Uncharacterized protein n=1 Tax=Pseudoalteromonas citrea DSM 8771 TaxID=1117314 RepID=U1JT10_9GAMM|nr:hypothetical protein [Pseudoalteromonas citrea]